MIPVYVLVTGRERLRMWNDYLTNKTSSALYSFLPPLKPILAEECFPLSYVAVPDRNQILFHHVFREHHWVWCARNTRRNNIQFLSGTATYIYWHSFGMLFMHSSCDCVKRFFPFRGVGLTSIFRFLSNSEALGARSLSSKLTIYWDAIHNH